MPWIELAIAYYSSVKRNILERRELAGLHVVNKFSAPYQSTDEHPAEPFYLPRTARKHPALANAVGQQLEFICLTQGEGLNVVEVAKSFNLFRRELDGNWACWPWWQ
ncbi:hypothetical protein SELMODRAFT_412213 [Selaginella moellendorffii]|uniref:Uncharacterized protein n=1 Tax=Selaginella moellendorffii TaxID=88036 RepID=D8RKG1_SELML|nr:hypothetical protein SELMODRAFT_431739 [Selaginella moellendorffii]EFJ27232.1 hypothetical protein SELMODRAFT_412213 [Selaginella moellendorffii]